MASMAQDPSGTREHLTPPQTRALYRLWQRFERLCETPLPYSAQQEPSAVGSTSSLHSPQATETDGADGVPGGFADPSSSTSARRPSPSTSTGPSKTYGKPLQRQPSNVREIDGRGSDFPHHDQLNDELKTLEEAKEMREFLERYGGARLREIFWDMVKGEHPDAVMLRFLRARKWNVDRAIAVIGSTAAFRADNDVANILKGGELAIYATRGGMKLLDNGVSYIYGATHFGEPIEIFEVGRHFSHNQTQDELKRGVIFLQEYLQTIMPPPIERKVVIFNLNDFGIRNMDWWCVFFMVKTMESYYVETLARVYVHGAPWIFKPIWAILKPLLDPVVRDKIRLTDRPEELSDYIPFNHLPKGTMRGGLDWDFEYPKPDPTENDEQKDTVTHERLHKEYMAIATEFERATREVAQVYARASLLRHKTARAGGFARKRGALGLGDVLSSDEEEDDSAPVGSRRPSMIPSDSVATPTGTATELDLADTLKARRDVLATKLRVAFLKLRPYIVGKSMVDRWGVTKPDGSMHWRYPTIDGKVEEQTLGMGTTLPELERNLAIIEDLLKQKEESQRQAASGNVPSGDSNATEQHLRPSGHSRQKSGAGMPSATAAAATNGAKDDRTRTSSAGSNSGDTDLNRRQQRLISRLQSQSLADTDERGEAGTNGVQGVAITDQPGMSSAIPARPSTPPAVVPTHPFNSPQKRSANLPDAQ